MPYYHCQLAIPSPKHSLDKTETLRWFNGIEDLKIIRNTHFFEDDTTSLNLLIESPHKLEAIHQHLTDILQVNQIQLSSSFGITQLKEEACVQQSCCGCSHDHEEHDHHHDHDDHHHADDNHHDHPHDDHYLKALIGLISGAGFVALTIFGAGLPFIATLAINLISTSLTLYLGWNVYKHAWQTLQEYRLTSSTLYTISTLTISIISTLSLFLPGLPMMMEAAPLVLGFWHLGEGIEHSLIDKLAAKIDVRADLPESVTLANSQEEILACQHLLTNDVFSLKGGNFIPVDGILLQDAYLYTTRIDGSPNLKHFKAGSEVKSGMLLATNNDAIEIRATALYQDSFLSSVAANITQANQNKAPIAEIAESILKYFVPTLLGVAITSAIVLSIFFPPAIVIQSIVSILVSACPCVFSLITPLAVKIGMQKAAEHGVHFKSGKALEASANIQKVVFDLNGTLTKGILHVDSMNVSDNKFLNWIAQLENESDHPVANIISQHINAQHTNQSSINLTNIDKSHHAGIKATIDGELFIIGNKTMLAENGITEFPSPYDNRANGETYVAYQSKVVGQISVKDELRQDAIETIQQLSQLGIDAHICTGADEETAMKFARELGIPESNICANALGANIEGCGISKQHYIESLKVAGFEVAMVGDAANDAAAIAEATLGIAVKSNIGDPSVEASAGMIIQQGELRPIATAFKVAQHTKNNILQNLGISLSYNSIITLIGSGLLIGVGFALNPALGVALMILESSIVLGNLFLLKSRQIGPAPKEQPTNELNTDEIEEKTPTEDKPILEAKQTKKIAHPSNCICSHHRNFFFPPVSKESAQNEVFCQLASTTFL